MKKTYFAPKSKTVILDKIVLCADSGGTDAGGTGHQGEPGGKFSKENEWDDEESTTDWGE